MHRDLLWAPAAFPFSLYLPANCFAQIVVPILQILAAPLLLHLALMGGPPSQQAWQIVLYLGLATFLAIALYSIALDRDWRSLRYVPLASLVIAPLSYFYNMVVGFSIWKEVRGEAELWEKVERLPSGAAARRGGLSLALAGTVLFVLALGLRLWRITAPAASAEGPAAMTRTPFSGVDLAVATHFDAWPDWHAAVASVLQAPGAAMIRTVGISAGRTEWAYFRWKGHEAQWSSDQAREPADLLGAATQAFRARGLRTVAIVDVYAPRLVRDTPQVAAMRFDGVRSPDQVCFTELVDGDYGRRVIDMASYLARHYPVDAIALTELAYSSSCFDDRCLASYRQWTRRSAWPTNPGPGGTPNPSDPSVWEWRSARMEDFLARVAAAVHAQGKQLMVDVPVSWSDLSRDGKDSGLDYHRVLRHADQIVVWDYFGVEHRRPESSGKLAASLRRKFPPGRIVMSIGLWGLRAPIQPAELRQGLDSTLKGGISNIWITPNQFLTPADWNGIEAALVERNDGIGH